MPLKRLSIAVKEPILTPLERPFNNALNISCLQRCFRNGKCIRFFDVFLKFSEPVKHYFWIAYYK